MIEEYGSQSTALALPSSERSEVARTLVQSQAEQEIRGAMVLARQFPRNEDAARQKLLVRASRFEFADEATYSFPRGGTTISGPSVSLAREMAQVWGNIRFGVKILADDADSRSIVGWAWDLETNAYEESPDVFQKLIQRKKGEGGVTIWVTPDERDLRELTNRRAAICVRNCILHLMPSNLLAEIVKKAQDTVATEGAKDPEAEKRKLLDAFTELHIPVPELEAYVGHSVGSCSPAELANLRGIYKAIKSGDAAWVDYYRKTDQAVVPEPGLAGAFAGAGASTIQRPGTTNVPEDRRRTLPTRLAQKREDERPVAQYLVDIVPTLPLEDLDAVAEAIGPRGNIKLKGSEMQAVLVAIGQRKTALENPQPETKTDPAPAQTAVESKPEPEPVAQRDPPEPALPPEVRQVMEGLRKSGSSMSVEMFEIQWNQIKERFPEHAERVETALTNAKDRQSVR